MNEDILDKIYNAGIVGAGGAGFPTHIKLSAKVSTVIANGAECEPLLRKDQELMLRKSEEVIKGLKTVMQLTGAAEGIIAAKRKYKHAIDELRKIINGSENVGIRLFELDDFYPAGDEQTLVYEVTRKIVPQGGIPLNVSVVVNNIETLVNIYNALSSEPVTHKYISVSGEVASPITTKVPIGISIGELIPLAGGTKIDDYLILVNGPMMGFVTEDHTLPVTKTLGGIVILPKSHYLIRKKLLTLRQEVKIAMTSCDQCLRCTEMCPRRLLGHSLEPHKNIWAINFKNEDIALLTQSFLCCECGICSMYACPEDISPMRFLRETKGLLIKHEIRKHEGQQNPTVSFWREYRKLPTKKLIKHLNIEKYDLAAPYVETKYVPGQVNIPLKQHLGKEATPVVKAGDIVVRGALIADVEKGAVGARIHSPIFGRVMSVNGRIEIKSIKDDRE